MALLSGLLGDINKYNTAHESNVANRYGGQPGTYETEIANAKSRRWIDRNNLRRDDAVVASGYEFYRGNPATNEADMRASGYITAGEAGATGANTSSGWYKANAPASSGGGGSAPSVGGGGSAPAPAPVAPPVAPEPFRLTSETGSAIGGDISATLGSVGKSPYDTTAKGLKGLTTPTGKAPVDRDKELERKRFGQGLFKVGVNLPGSGTGVQV